MKMYKIYAYNQHNSLLLNFITTEHLIYHQIEYKIAKSFFLTLTFQGFKT